LLRKAAYGGGVYLPRALLFSSSEVNSDCGFHLGNYLPPKKGRQAKPALRSKVMNSLFPKPFRYLKNYFVYSLSLSAERLFYMKYEQRMNKSAVTECFMLRSLNTD